MGLAVVGASSEGASPGGWGFCSAVRRDFPPVTDSGPSAALPARGRIGWGCGFRLGVAEALDQRHRAALRGGAINARLICQPSRDHAMHGAQHRADGVGLAGEQQAQGIGKTQNPLPHRARAEHIFHEVPRTLGHAACTAARVKPALLAGEGQQPLRFECRWGHFRQDVASDLPVSRSIEVAPTARATHAPQM